MIVGFDVFIVNYRMEAENMRTTQMKAEKFRIPRTFGGTENRHLIALISANLHSSVPQLCATGKENYSNSHQLKWNRIQNRIIQFRKPLTLTRRQMEMCRERNTDI